MSLKTIMLALMPGEDDPLPDIVRPTLELSERFGAHLSVVIGAHEVKPGIVISYAPVVGYLTEENARRVGRAQALAEEIRRACATHGVSASSTLVDGTFDDMLHGFARHARVHDLVVSATAGEDEMFQGSMASALLFESGRPVLFMPERAGGPYPFERIVIAWDGSAQAARAVGDAHAFLDLAKSASIVCVTGEKDLSRAIPGAELAERIAHHDVEVSVADLPLKGSVAEVVLAHAQSVGAGLIVMGAYAHSRWRQLVLGGATRDMLRTTRLPVLMAH